MTDFGKTTKRNAALREIPIKVCGVYCIKNNKNGKFYIGSATDIRRRLRHHLIMLRGKTHNSTHLQNAFLHDGESVFSFSVLELCEKNIRLEREQFFLDTLTPHNHDIGYNISIRADSGPSVVYTPEMRAALSERMKGRKLSEEHKKRIGEAQKIRRCAPEMRQRISQKLKEFYANPENRKAQSIRQTGVKRRGTPWTAQQREKLVETWTGKPRPQNRKHPDSKIDGWIKMHESGMTFFQISLQERVNQVVIQRCVKRRKQELT